MGETPTTFNSADKDRGSVRNWVKSFNKGHYEMGDVTKIQWTDHTFNPWVGCTKVAPG